MQKLRDKICKLVKTTCRRGDEDSQGNCTTKTKKDEQCSQKCFSPVRYFFRKISPHFITPRNEFLFQRPKKNVSNYDNVWYRRRHCLSERFLKSEWRMKNETGQLSRQITLYWPQKFKQYPKLQPTQPINVKCSKLWCLWLEAFLTYLRCCFFPKKEQMWTYTMLIMVLKFPL